MADVLTVFLGGVRKLICLKLGVKASLHVLSNSVFTNYRILYFPFRALHCNNQQLSYHLMLYNFRNGVDVKYTVKLSFIVPSFLLTRREIAGLPSGRSEKIYL